MSEIPRLSREGVDLLLQLLESPEPLLSAAAAELHALEVEPLVGAGLLVAHDHEEVVADLDDHSDVPVPLNWFEPAGGLAYFSAVAGLVPVLPQQLLRRRVNVSQALAAMTIGIDLPEGNAPFELIEGLLWEIGEARLTRRAMRVSIWFARCLWNRDVQNQITAAARSRPHPRQRVVLTSSRPERVSDFAVAGILVVPLRDVLASPDGLAIGVAILGARLAGVPADQAGPISLSADGAQLRINGGEPIAFRSDKQKAAIRRLVDAYRIGRGVPITELTDLGSPMRFFGAQKWRLLSPILKSVNGLWTFEP